MESLPQYSLAEEPLEDLLLTLEARGESAQVHVETTDGPGHLFISQGQLSLAQFGRQKGSSALYALLAYRDGDYRVSAAEADPSAQSLGELSQILNAHSRSSTLFGASGKRRALRLNARLTRGSSKLPDGLNASELRALSLIDARSSTKSVISGLKLPAAEALRAIRSLISHGLVVEDNAITGSPTIALTSTGSSTPLSFDERESGRHASGQRESGQRTGIKASQTQRQFSAPTAPTTVRNHASRAPQGDESNSAADDISLKKPSVGPWAKKPEQRHRLGHTAYSSVPPRSLAEDQVSLPKALSTKPSPADQASEESQAASEHLNRFVAQAEPKPWTGDIRPVDYRDIVRHDTPTALSVARVLPDEQGPGSSHSQSHEAQLRHPQPRHPQLRDSEIPVPSNRLDPASLEQLDELNAALSSSHFHSRPHNSRPVSSRPTSSGLAGSRAASSRPFRARPISAFETGTEAIEPGPPSSLGLGLGLDYGDLPPPGSVPSSHELPGQGERSEDSQLPLVGRYEILARLKRGGMGSVYMCRLSGTAGFRRLFAMKVLHGHLAEQNASLEAFFHEARVLGGLHHPNIVGIADVGTPNEPYIVMDYVEGGSLAEIFRATPEGRDPALIVSILLDALNGLTYAHTACDESGQPLELVHCDITPHNLLVGIDGTCRVTDFGIARTRNQGDDGLVQGKPGYLAPERLRQQPADHRSDVFSMGVVLYLGLTGVEPFRGVDNDDCSRLTLLGNVEPPSEVGLKPPPALDWVCMKALSADPATRFSSAEEMALQLRRVAERANLRATSSEVATWVRTSLGPTLAARRAASLRGSGSELPPPVSEYADPGPPQRRISSPLPEALSAAEHTGPLDPPPSSHQFNDNTEIIRDPSSGTQASPSRARRMATYLAIALVAVFVGWALRKPQLLSQLTQTEPTQTTAPPSSDKSGQDEQEDEDGVPPQSKKVEFDEDGNVVIPAIEPSGKK